MSREKEIIVIILAFASISSLLAVAVSASETDVASIQPLGSGGWSLNLQENDKVSGQVFISHSIKFRITNPDGFIIKDYGTINQTTSYDFSATKAGKYSLIFQSLYLGETQVQASYNIQSAGLLLKSSPSILNSDLSQTITGIIVAVALLVSLVFVGEKWLRKRRHTNLSVKPVD